MSEAVSIPISIRANVLGDARGELDKRMLDLAFYESPDYRTLIESNDRSIVVGRRGTGKSALAYRLGKHFERADGCRVLSIGPDDHEIIGLRSLTKLFGTEFRIIRAGSIIAWRYAFLLEIAESVAKNYKAKKHDAWRVLEPHVDLWKDHHATVVNKLTTLLYRTIVKDQTPETVVGSLPRTLSIREIEAAVRQLLDDLGIQVILLLDRLDEGYEPDDIGTGLIDGLVQAALDVKDKIPSVRPIVFLRDNVYRAVARLDPDFSRSIEGQTLRLHWDEYNLLSLTANRLREAFEVDQEQSIKVWDRCADAGLEGKDGFRRCLRLTLYRPRDLLTLLNNAFLRAAQQRRARIVPADLDSSSKEISVNRLDDLRKEYTHILPCLGNLMAAFSNGPAEMSVGRACSQLAPVFAREDFSVEARRYLAIVQTPEACLKDLFSVGFFGLKDTTTGNFVFCHDGRNPNREFLVERLLLIHPCYWIALNASNREMEPEAAQEIYDEYEISVTSETPERRSAEIGRLIAEEGKIPAGKSGWFAFEEWSLRALQIVFAGHLSNIQLHENGDSAQKRDVIARNIAETRFWRSVKEDYGTRQVIFEIKNYDEIGADDFRQALAYLSGEYGRLVLFVTRAKDDSLRKGVELDWVRILYFEHEKRLAMKLSSKVLCSLLGRLRSPQKHDASERYMEGLIDRYVRMYLASARSKTS